MPHPALITVDWGTSSMRSALLARDGTVLDERSGGPGILAVPANGFASALLDHIRPWRSLHGPLPIILSGMIGSRQGWVEVPYLACPAGKTDLAAHLHRHETGQLGPIHIVPGLSIEPPGKAPDVMRGEETQIAGALDGSIGERGLYVLPGTHSKWVTVENGRITHFATYMTGEIFAALRHHTILGRLMPAETEQAGTDQAGAAAFQQGVEAGVTEGPPGALLQLLFTTRTLGLFDRLPAASLSSYLSGLLIGSEISAAFADKRLKRHFTIVGSAPALAGHYSTAARILDLETSLAPASCAARGAYLLARAAGLIKGTSP
jgi:2-dehydro-3-deoxygalactonokinase